MSNPTPHNYLAITLIELVITIMIIAMLCIIAGASYQRLQCRLHLIKNAGSLYYHLQLARLLALQGNGDSIICPSSSNKHCGLNWSSGILVKNNHKIFLAKAPKATESRIQWTGNIPIQLKAHTGQTAQNGHFAITSPCSTEKITLWLSIHGRTRMALL